MAWITYDLWIPHFTQKMWGTRRKRALDISVTWVTWQHFGQARCQYVFHHLSPSTRHFRMLNLLNLEKTWNRMQGFSTTEHWICFDQSSSCKLVRHSPVEKHWCVLRLGELQASLGNAKEGLVLQVRSHSEIASMTQRAFRYLASMHMAHIYIYIYIYIWPYIRTLSSERGSRILHYALQCIAAQSFEQDQYISRVKHHMVPLGSGCKQF